MTDCKLFDREIAPGIYRISDALHGPCADGYSDAPGAATQNSYLVLGEKRAALIDLAIDTPELYDYARRLTGKPVIILLTHGHPDHIYNIGKVSEVWLHPADAFMITEGIPGISAPVGGVTIHPLSDGEETDLGGRKLTAIHIPGHTPGSLLFLDAQTRTLLAGDTCARRLLYGVTPSVPIKNYIQDLRKLSGYEFDVIYTAHDRCALPKQYINTTIEALTRGGLKGSRQTIEIPGVDSMRFLRFGNEDSLSYFDCAVKDEYAEV